MNDLSREVGGAVGIAVLSSVLASGYRASIDLTAVPERLRPLVESSGPAAMHLPIPAVQQLATAAYTSGLQSALLVGAGVLLAGSALLQACAGRRPDRLG